MDVATERDILTLGLLAMGYGGYPNVPMAGVVDLLLNSTNDDGIVPLIPRLGLNDTKEASDIVRNKLEALQDYLLTAPNDNCKSITRVHLSVIMAVALFFLIMRFTVRLKFIGWVNRADWAMVITWLWSLVMVIIMHINTEKYNGCSHLWKVSYEDYKGFHFTFVLISFFYTIALYALKVAFMIFFWDLSPYRTMRCMIVVVFILHTATCLVAVFTVWFECQPLSFWNHPLEAKWMPALKSLWIGIGAFLILGDLALLAIPIPYVWRLRIERREKIIVIGLFLLGSIVCGATVLRVTHAVAYVDQLDITYKVGSAEFWATFELQLGVVVSCLPALRSLFVRFVPALLGQKGDVAGFRNDADVMELGEGQAEVGKLRALKDEWSRRRATLDRKYRIAVGLTSDYSKEATESETGLHDQDDGGVAGHDAGSEVKDASTSKVVTVAPE